MTSFVDLPQELRIQIFEACLPDDIESLALTCHTNYDLAAAHVLPTHNERRRTWSSIALMGDSHSLPPTFSLQPSRGRLQDSDPFSPEQIFDHITRHYPKTIRLTAPHPAVESALYDQLSYLYAYGRNVGIDMFAGADLATAQLDFHQQQLLTLAALVGLFPNVCAFVFRSDTTHYFQPGRCDVLQKLRDSPFRAAAAQLFAMRRLKLTPAQPGLITMCLYLGRLTWVLQLEQLEVLEVSGLRGTFAADRPKRGCRHRQRHEALRIVRLKYSQRESLEMIKEFVGQIVGLMELTLLSNSPSMQEGLDDIKREIYGKILSKGKLDMAEKPMQGTGWQEGSDIQQGESADAAVCSVPAETGTY